MGWLGEMRRGVELLPAPERRRCGAVLGEMDNANIILVHGCAGVNIRICAGCEFRAVGCGWQGRGENHQEARRKDRRERPGDADERG